MEICTIHNRKATHSTSITFIMPLYMFLTITGVIISTLLICNNTYLQLAFAGKQLQFPSSISSSQRTIFFMPISLKLTFVKYWQQSLVQLMPKEMQQYGCIDTDFLQHWDIQRLQSNQIQIFAPCSAGNLLTIHMCGK